MADLLECMMYGIQIPWNTRLLGFEEPASYGMSGMSELHVDSCDFFFFFDFFLLFHDVKQLYSR